MLLKKGCVNKTPCRLSYVLAEMIFLWCEVFDHEYIHFKISLFAKHKNAAIFTNLDLNADCFLYSMNKHLFWRTMAIFPPITGTLLIPYLEVQMEGSQVCCQGNHRWTHPGSWTAHSCPVTYKKLLCICNISSVLFVNIV